MGTRRSPRRRARAGARPRSERSAPATPPTAATGLEASSSRRGRQSASSAAARCACPSGWRWWSPHDRAGHRPCPADSDTAAHSPCDPPAASSQSAWRSGARQARVQSSQAAGICLAQGSGRGAQGGCARAKGGGGGTGKGRAPGCASGSDRAAAPSKKERARGYLIPVSLIVLPRSCSRRWGPCPSPTPCLVCPFYLLLVQVGTLSSSPINRLVVLFYFFLSFVT